MPVHTVILEIFSVQLFLYDLLVYKNEKQIFLLQTHITMRELVPLILHCSRVWFGTLVVFLRCLIKKLYG